MREIIFDCLEWVVKVVVKVLAICFCFGLVVMTIFWSVMGITWTVSGFEYKTWNKLHNTNYTQYDWFSGSDFIKKYHYPNRKDTDKNEINVNLN